MSAQRHAALAPCRGGLTLSFVFGTTGIIFARARDRGSLKSGPAPADRYRQDAANISAAIRSVFCVINKVESDERGSSIGP